MFDQSSILDVKPPIWDGSALLLEWESSAPEGTVFQVYLDRVLAWHGTSRWVSLPMPETRGRIDIGAVEPHEATTDFSASLPPAADLRARLSWLGGSYLDPTGRDDVAGFHVLGENSPGRGIDLDEPLATIPAYPGGIISDGFGLGGFGEGGFGRAASAYSWTSPALRSGAWSFAVASFDAAGNRGVPAIRVVSIAAPPRPPAPFEDGSRLRAAYDPATRAVTLSWRPSPS
ncbi:MAG: hypothetical protein U0790_23795 [Isosphaeraceae bacterium]